MYRGIWERRWPGDSDILDQGDFKSKTEAVKWLISCARNAKIPYDALHTERGKLLKWTGRKWIPVKYGSST
jgi:hypothetical protein